ncbi:MAG: type IX secretion system membrane protein PorP/SprF [bacterium]
MARIIKTSLLMLIFLALVSVHSKAAFKDTGWGARPSSMGNAFGAVSDDVNAVFYNPAGIAQLDQTETHFMYARRFTGLDDVNLGLNYFAFGKPVSKYEAWAFSWARFSAKSIYNEDTVALSYSRIVSKIEEAAGVKVFVGGNIKLLRNEFKLDDQLRGDPVFEKGKHAEAFAVDLGLLLKWEREAVGLSVKTLNEPNIGLKETERIPREYRLAVNHIFGDIGLIQDAHTSLDLTLRDEDYNVHLGWENYFLDKTLSFRCGGSAHELSVGFGSYLSLGEAFGIQLDYAFLWPLELEDTTGSHRISLVTRFGQKK